MSIQATQERITLPPPSPQAGLLQRKCSGCGNHTVAGGGCFECGKKKSLLHRKAANSEEVNEIPQSVHKVLRSTGQPLDHATRAYMEPRFGYDFSRVRVHADSYAAESARSVKAQAYTVGRDVVFGAGQFAPHTSTGQELLAHELTHVVQQRGTDHHGSVSGIAAENSEAERNADSIAASVTSGGPVNPIAAPANALHLRREPYIKKVTVHLTPPQTADLEWQGTAPSTAPGSDHFTVSTGKGYSDPGDPAGTCTRDCCSDPDTQCEPPWDRPRRVGACCTFTGDNFWTGVPQDEHNGWLYWTPIQPHYSRRGIALHQHTEVTGQPIGHGCVRMAEENAHRIYEYSNRRRTNVTIEGTATPVLCEAGRRCAGSTGGGAGGAGARREGETVDETQLAAREQEAVPGLEGLLT